MKPIAKFKIGKNIQSLAHSENKVVAASTGGTVIIFRFSTFDKPPDVLYEFTANCQSLTVSKNGRYVAFSDVYEVTRIDLSNGELKALPSPSFVTAVSNDGLVLHCNHLEAPDYLAVWDGNASTQLSVSRPLAGEIFADTFENEIAVCSGVDCGTGRIGEAITLTARRGKTVGVYHNGVSFIRATGDGTLEELSAESTGKSEIGVPLYGILPSGGVQVGVTLDGGYVSLPSANGVFDYFSRLSKNAKDHRWFYVSPVPPMVEGNDILVYVAFLGTISPGYIPIVEAKKYGYSHCQFVTMEGTVEFPISDIQNEWLSDNASSVMQINLIKPLMDRWKSFSGKARPAVSVGPLNAYVFGSESPFAIGLPETTLTRVNDITTYGEAE